MNDTVLILNNIRSVYNAGAIFRTADALGIRRIFLCGYTPLPIDRFGKARSDFAKTALGAEKTISWEFVKSVGVLVSRLKKEGFQICALEQSKSSVDYKKVRLAKKSAIILGNEVRGLSKNILNKCDVVAEIPMKGKKESLNVSVAGGIFLFRLLDK